MRVRERRDRRAEPEVSTPPMKKERRGKRKRKKEEEKGRGRGEGRGSARFQPLQEEKRKRDIE